MQRYVIISLNEPLHVSSETTVLIVDDAPDFLLITKKYLEDKSDLHIELASSVDEANRLLAEKPFDVIVSDHQMPNKNGIAFLTELRDKGDLTPLSYSQVRDVKKSPFKL